MRCMFLSGLNSLIFLSLSLYAFIPSKSFTREQDPQKFSLHSSVSINEKQFPSNLEGVMEDGGGRVQREPVVRGNNGLAPPALLRVVLNLQHVVGEGLAEQQLVVGKPGLGLSSADHRQLLRLRIGPFEKLEISPIRRKRGKRKSTSISVASSLVEERFRRTVLASEAWLVTRRRAMTMKEKKEEEERNSVGS